MSYIEVVIYTCVCLSVWMIFAWSVRNIDDIYFEELLYRLLSLSSILCIKFNLFILLFF